MSNSAYTIRNYQPADFTKYVQLHITAEELEPSGRRASAQVIAEHLGRPNYFSEQDLFIVTTAGNIIGYLGVTAELTIGRVILDCWVHPEHRRKGLATKLLACATHRAKTLGAKVIHINIAQDNMVAKSALSRLGFDCVRRFLELKLDLAEMPWPALERVALECRYLRPGEEDKLTRMQNRAFAGTWGYNPNTVETIIYSLNLSNRSSGDVVLACAGDKVIGYCWTEITSKGEAIGKNKGRIFMMGADPDYRGRGVGRRVLLAGLAHLKGKGLRVAELTVDSENQVACDLYRSVGFEVQTSILWYEKLLSSSPR